MEPWIFDNFRYWEGRRDILRPDGRILRVRPKVSELLLVFLRAPGKLVDREVLLNEVWPDNKTVTFQALYGLKDELDNALGTSELIESIPGAGYIFKAQTVLSPADNKPQEGAALHVFPGAGSVAGYSYAHSWASHGRNDTVLTSTEKMKWEEHPRRLVLLNPDVPSVLMLPFKHSLSDQAIEESWWAAALPIYTDRLTGKWTPIDLREYKALVVEARAVGPDGAGSIFLRVRLEDNAENSQSASKRQSTSWHPQVFCLLKDFFAFEVNLDGFNWSKDAWPRNTAPVNRRAVVQVVIGQDATIPSCAGTIEIRNIRFLPQNAQTAEAHAAEKLA
jgi:DNA-binding winged helix-turn-helix (wHTH) protein